MFINKLFLLIVLITLFSMFSQTAQASIYDEAREKLIKAGWTEKLANKIIFKIEMSKGRFIAIFDHDNTLVSGDITEGNGKSQPGFMYPLIKQMHRDHSLPVPIEGIYESDPWKFYHAWAKVNHEEAYGWICTLLAGQTPEQVLSDGCAYYEKYQKQAIFPEMKALVTVLQDLEVEVHIVSASAHNLVLAASKYFKIPLERIHGIRLQITKGIIQPKVIRPISFAAGKTWYIENIIGDAKPGNIMTFGDSYTTDGHMLRYAARQDGIAILVNPSDSIKETLKNNRILFYDLPSLPMVDR